MMYLKYAGLLMLDLLSGLLNLILTPLVVLFADFDGWLPAWLWWFQTPDNPIDGDSGWQTENRWFLTQDTLWKMWLNRIGWLYRNPTYGFAISVLGAQALAGDVLVTSGDPLTGNHPMHAG